MKILITAPVLFPCGGDARYQGIERLCALWANELHKRGHKVTVASAEGSCFSRDIEHIAVPQGDFVQGELVAYGCYCHRLHEFDIILDFSHSHWAMRQHELPGIAWTWHDPGIMQPPLPLYNVASLSEWQKTRLYQFQETKARVVDCHCGEATKLFESHSQTFPLLIRGFIFVGKIGPLKGAWEAAKICRELNASLIIIGEAGPGDPPEYADKLRAECNDRIVWLKGASDAVRANLTLSSKALIYPLQYPKGTGEAHSHKIVDCLLLGTPVVTYDVGAMSEVIEHGVDGFLARSEEEFKDYMGKVGELDREKIEQRAEEKWRVDNVVERYMPLLGEIAGGLRW